MTNSPSKPEMFTSKKEAAGYLRTILQSNGQSVEILEVFMRIIIMDLFGKPIHYFDQDYVLAANCFKHSTKKIRDYALYMLAQV